MSISVTPGDRLGAYEANGGGEETPQGKNFSVFVARGKLFWMLFRFAFLTIITLGIYRFWAKTKLRRYLWSVVEYDGDRFEYHGTAKELFLGFLIAPRGSAAAGCFEWCPGSAGLCRRRL